MLRAAGAALICAACVYAGFYKARLLHRRTATLRAFIGVVGQIRQEIGNRLTALPDLLRVLKRDRPDMADFIGCIERDWNQSDYLGFSRAWREALEPLELTEEDKHLLWGVGNALGRFDAGTQVAALESTIAALERQYEAALAMERQNAKLYPTLGVTAGVMAVILIL